MTEEKLAEDDGLFDGMEEKATTLTTIIGKKPEVEPELKPEVNVNVDVSKQENEVFETGSVAATPKIILPIPTDDSDDIFK